MSVAAKSLTGEPLGSTMVKAMIGGAVAVAITRFAMDPIALSMFGVTFAAPGIYAFMLKSAFGVDSNIVAGWAVHLAVFVILVPILSVMPLRRIGSAGQVFMALSAAFLVWLLLMIVLLPAGGLPFFYAFSLTTIWSGVAFAILGLSIAAALSLLPGKE